MMLMCLNVYHEYFKSAFKVRFRLQDVFVKKHLNGVLS